MKSPITALAAFAAVSLLSACSQPREQGTSHTTVSLWAAGEVEVQPNEATLTIRLSNLRPDARSAKAYLVEQSNALHDTLTSFGVSPEHIQTLGVDLERSYAWRNGSQAFQGYRGATSMIVRVTELGRLDEIYDELLDRRELDTYGPTYGHSDMDSLRNVAYLRALDQADALGEALQSRLSAKHRAVRAIGNVELPKDHPYGYEMDARARPTAVVAEQAAAQRFEVSTGLIKVTADLYVDYEVW